MRAYFLKADFPLADADADKERPLTMVQTGHLGHLAKFGTPNHVVDLQFQAPVAKRGRRVGFAIKVRCFLFELFALAVGYVLRGHGCFARFLGLLAQLLQADEFRTFAASTSEIAPGALEKFVG